MSARDEKHARHLRMPRYRPGPDTGGGRFIASRALAGFAMARGASSHFSLKRAEYDRYYPTVLGVLQNSGFLVMDADRDENRAFLQGLPRSGAGPGVEIEIRRRPKGLDIHVLVVPHEDLPQEKGQFLMRQGVFGTLQSDPASERTLAGILPALRRDNMERAVDPSFRRPPPNIPEWIFFNLKKGTPPWFLGILSGIVGAIAGVIGGRIFPLKVKRSAESI